MTISRQPIRKSARKSKTAIAERKNKEKIRRTITITESTIVTVGNIQKENKVEFSFIPPFEHEIPSKEDKKKKKFIEK